MKKNIMIWMGCGLMISCSGATPTPSAEQVVEQPVEQPALSSSPSNTQTASVPVEVEQRTDLDASRIKIDPKLDTQQVWQELSVQREVAQTYEKRKTMCEAFGSNESGECDTNPECTLRVSRSFDESAIERAVCTAKDAGTELFSFQKEQGMLQCMGMSGTTWHLYRGDPGAPADQVYQQCLCDAPAQSIESYAEQGLVRPNAKAGMCISEQARCAQEGGQFQEARLLGKVSPEEYAAHGLSIQFNERLQWCGVATARLSEAAEDDIFLGMLENGTCAVYRFKGYKIKPSAPAGQIVPSYPVRYSFHACKIATQPIARAFSEWGALQAVG